MLNTSGLIVIILLLIFLIYILRNKVVDNFIIFLDNVIIPKSCYNYLVTNGKHFFLLNTKQILDGINNPLKFNTKVEAIKYLKDAKCPDTIPFVDLVMQKNLDDPTVSYQRECSKKVAKNLFDLNVCNTYGSDETLAKKNMKRESTTQKNSDFLERNDECLLPNPPASCQQKIISELELKNKERIEKRKYANYGIETCMINKAIDEEPKLDDTNFKDEFAKYFDRLNSNIDEEYLYISGR